MQSPLVGFFLLSLVLEAGAQPATSNEPPSPVLEKVFKSSLSPEQMTVLGPGANLENMARSMTPEQRAGAQQQLVAAEARARAPKDLKEIARGYLILNEGAPNAGLDTLRIAADLQRQNPGDPEGHTIASVAFFQQGKYEAASEEAKAALRLNPRDHVAYTTLMLSEGRRGQASPAAAPPVKGVVEPPTPTNDPAAEKGSFKPVVRAGRIKAVPALVTERQAGMPRRTLTQRVSGIMDLQVEKVLNSLDPQEHLTADDRAAVVQNTKGAALAGGVVGGVVIGTTGLGGCAAAQVYGVPYPICVPLVALGGVAVGGFTGAFFIGSGTYIFFRAKQQWKELMEKP